MTREQEIKEMAKTTASHITNDKDMQVAFADALRRGAEWAFDYALQEAKSVVLEHFGIEDKYADEVEDLFNKLEERLGK